MRKIVGDKNSINRLSIDKRRQQKPINRLSVCKALTAALFAYCGELRRYVW